MLLPDSTADLFCDFHLSLSTSFLCKGLLLKLYLELSLELGFQVVHDSGLLLPSAQAALLVHGDLGQELLLQRPHPGGRSEGCQRCPGQRVNQRPSTGLSRVPAESWELVLMAALEPSER